MHANQQGAIAVVDASAAPDINACHLAEAWACRIADAAVSDGVVGNAFRARRSIVQVRARVVRVEFVTLTYGHSSEADQNIRSATAAVVRDVDCEPVVVCRRADRVEIKQRVHRVWIVAEPT